MASSIEALTYTTLTAAQNEIANPATFLTSLLYPNEQVLGTETIELSTVSSGRNVAPFVHKDGEAVMIPGTSRSFATIAPPNIRIKMPFTAARYAFERQPGSQLHLAPGVSTEQWANQAIARDVAELERNIQHAEEYLVSRTLQGSFSYQTADQENITITIPRSTANSYQLATYWDDATPANTRPLADIFGVKKILSNIPGLEGLAVTDAICGTDAANALLELVEVGAVKMLGLDGTNVRAGDITFVEQFQNTGAIFLGTLGGVRFWHYGRQLTLANGTTVDLIRPKWVEFINNNATLSDRVMYYGAIADMDALGQGVMATKRFSKQWTQPDPSARFVLSASRPCPWPRRANATVSVQVVAP